MHTQSPPYINHLYIAFVCGLYATDPTFYRNQKQPRRRAVSSFVASAGRGPRGSRAVPWSPWWSTRWRRAVLRARSSWCPEKERNGTKKRNMPLHPWRLTWNIIMEVWKIIFHFKWVICRFHVNLPGCMAVALVVHPSNFHHMNLAFLCQFDYVTTVDGRKSGDHHLGCIKPL